MNGQPATFDKAERIFNLMSERATREPIYDGGFDVVYEGFLTGLFSELHFAAPQYTIVMQVLKAMGCVEQLTRGGGSAQSRWRLIKPPTIQDYTIAHANPIPTKPQGSMTNQALQQQIRDINARLVRVEGALGLP